MPPGASDSASIWIRLQGVTEFVTGAKAEKDALTAIGAAAEVTGVKMERTGKRGFLMNQMFFTARRYLYGFTLALTAAATGAVIMGFKFDAMMQSTKLAFGGLLHSTKLASDEVNFLFSMAAHSPFLFQQLADTTRQMLAFQIPLKETNRIMTDAGNALAYFGKSGEMLPRIGYIFGEIHSSGFLLMRQMRQLVYAGIPAFPALRQELHLTQAEMTKFMEGKLKIPADLGIEAVLRYMESHFGDGMNRFARTWQGRWTTFKDYSQMIMGNLVAGIFTKVTNSFGDINGALQKLNDTLTHKGFTAFLKQLDSMLGMGGRLVMFIGFIKNFATGFIILAKDMWQVGKITGYIFYPLFVALYGLGTAFAWAMKHLGPFKWLLLPVVAALQLFVFWTAAGRTITRLLAVTMYFAKGAWAVYQFTVRLTTTAIEAYNLASTIGTRNAVLMVLKVMKLNGAYRLLEKGVWRMVGAFRALRNAQIAAELSDPLVLLIVLIVALYVAFVILMIKVKAFRDFMFRWGWIIFAFIPGLQLVSVLLLIIGHWKQLKQVVGDVINFIKQHWLDLLLFLTTGGLGNLLYHFWDPMVSAFVTAWNWVKMQFWNAVHWIEGLFRQMWKNVKQMAQDAMDPRNWIPFGLGSLVGGKGHVGFGWKDALNLAIPGAGTILKHFASGGVMNQSGLAVVGERGPELMWLPKATNVQPMSRIRDIGYQPMQQFGGGRELKIHVPVNIHGAPVAEANAAVMLDYMARQ